MVDLTSVLHNEASDTQCDNTLYGSEVTPYAVLPTQHGGQKGTLFGPNTDVVTKFAQVRKGRSSVSLTDVFGDL